MGEVLFVEGEDHLAHAALADGCDGVVLLHGRSRDNLPAHFSVRASLLIG